MRRVLFTVLSAVVVLGLLGLARAADADSKAVLEKAIKAHGGEEALEKYKAGQSRNKGKLAIPGVGEVEFTQEMSFMLPDKLKESMEFEIMNVKVAVTTRVNGDKISIEANGKEVPITDAIKEALDGARHQMKTARLVSLLKDKTLEVTSRGEEKLDGKPVMGVLVKAKDRQDINLFFDKETGLLTKVEYRTVDATTGKAVTEERIITEYGKPGKEGMAMPKKVLVKRDGEKFLEVEVEEAKLFETLDDSEFTKP